MKSRLAHPEIDRVIAGLEHLQQVSVDESGRGVNRLAFSPNDLAARTWFRGEAELAGLQVEQDCFGNILARLDGTESGPVVASGSHLDSVPGGGNYDGALGALCALEVVRSFKQSGIRFKHPLIAIGFAAEESVRFGRGCLGSQVMTGALSGESLLSLQDEKGITLQDTLEHAGLQPQNLANAIRAPGWAKAFVEVHLDQGAELRDDNLVLGVVTGISAPVRYAITFQGETMHSGAAAMSKRRDAMAGAAELILEIERLGHLAEDRGLVTTVGKVRVMPGLMTAVPGTVELGIDVRGPDKALVESTWKHITAYAEGLSQRRGLAVSRQLLWESHPVLCDSQIVSTLASASASLNIPYRTMFSGSGHDAMYLASQMPVGMLFVRNIGGVSHNPAEYASPEDINAALRVLANVLAELAS